MNKLIISIFLLTFVLYADNNTNVEKYQKEIDNIENSIRKEDKDLDNISENLLDKKIDEKNILIKINNKLNKNEIKQIKIFLENKLFYSSNELKKQTIVSKKLYHKNIYNYKIKLYIIKNKKEIVKEFKNKSSFVKKLVLNIKKNKNLIEISKE